VLDTIHLRKARMIELSDAFIALPGGFGTLEELFEILTWAQVGLHHKPVGLLNTQRYFDPLLRLLDHIEQEGLSTASTASCCATPRPRRPCWMRWKTTPARMGWSAG
jgi:uncharacterized protein (TIGR00730 family)